MAPSAQQRGVSAGLRLVPNSKYYIDLLVVVMLVEVLTGCVFAMRSCVLDIDPLYG